MATLWITELRGVAAVGAAVTQAPIMPPLATQALVFTTSAQSDALTNATELVRVVASAACHIAIGADPTATTSDTYLVAGSAEYFAVPPTGTLKIAAVEAA